MAANRPSADTEGMAWMVYAHYLGGDEIHIEARLDGTPRTRIYTADDILATV